MDYIYITKAQALERFGEARVRFSSYYKYEFCYSGECDGKPFSLSIGGDHNDIYKLSVDQSELTATDLINEWFGDQIMLWEGKAVRIRDSY